MSTNYQKGAQREYKTRNKMKDRGYTAIRSAGSHGPFDVIAWNEHEIIFIQTKMGYTMELEEMETFLNNEIPPNGIKQLWIYFKGKQPIILSEGEVRNDYKRKLNRES